ncbi:alpha/beta-hydrolase [Trametes versicolor FP-101664 SS1]|uniref:alpha/beta-hydrolase n=1 Tax=Trametes versicolor (strain FP-101664) TaxID=717944 RepID=UPI0004621B22|nr:alpha/beta-hydrolase [Trametes versicolor FP-101664 SS1]EIW59500.1 alpha/beta-hydrolase [Trametes versicolor FP-101664 SS1]
MTTPPGSTSQKTTKFAIPHPYEKDCAITGVLEQVAPDQPTQGRKIALILHGALGHKDYLFQKKLAYRLSQDSFRFDFRGNHETPGTWAFGRFTNDVLDLEVVVDYLAREFGYVVDMVVGHSRGSVVGMLWLCKHRDGAAKDATRYVNVSGRYRMEKIYDDLELHKAELESTGFVLRTATVARKPFVSKVTREDYEEFANVDTSVVWDQFPTHVDVLTLHGLKDAVVPPFDAVIYARIYGARSPGTHTLRIVEEADHNFTGVPEEVVDTVLEWIQQQDRKELKTGVWHTGIKDAELGKSFRGRTSML